MTSQISFLSSNKIVKLIAFFLFLSLPFQRSVFFLQRHAQKLIPIDLSIPPSFDTSIVFSFGELVLLAMVAAWICNLKFRIQDFLSPGPVRYSVLFLSIALISIMNSSTACYPLQYFRLIQLSLCFLFPIVCLG